MSVGLIIRTEIYVRDKFVRASNRALSRVARLANKADVSMTVELHSLARVASFIMKENAEQGYRIEAEEPS